MRQRSGSNGNAPYERLMMTFVNMDSPGLVVLPTHRVVFGLDAFDVAAMNTKLEKYFDVEKPRARNRREVGAGSTARGGQEPFCAYWP